MLSEGLRRPCCVDAGNVHPLCSKSRSEARSAKLASVGRVATEMPELLGRAGMEPPMGGPRRGCGTGLGLREGTRKESIGLGWGCSGCRILRLDGVVWVGWDAGCGW